MSWATGEMHDKLQRGDVYMKMDCGRVGQSSSTFPCPGLPGIVGFAQAARSVGASANPIHPVELSRNAPA
jgi:hypothetical protein